MQFAPAGLNELLDLRQKYLDEVNCQIVHHSHFERGFNQPWLIKDGHTTLGYGAIGDYDHRKAEVIKEFHLIPEARADGLKIFREFIKVTKAIRVEAQTNDIQLTLLLYDTCEDIMPDLYLFADSGIPTSLKVDGAVFRKLTEKERGTAFDHNAEPIGDFGIEKDGTIVATGGWLTHYNKSFADLYMEVNPEFRKKGIGSFLIQELIRECRAADFTPAARTGIDNQASRRTLERGGMNLCARILTGRIR